MKATVFGVFEDLKFSWDSQQGRLRTTSILVWAFWNFKCKVLKYSRTCLHNTLIPNLVKPLNMRTFKSVISCHFFDFLRQHSVGRCLNSCHNKSFVSHNVDWHKIIRNSIDSCQIQTCQLIPSANRFQTSGLYRLIISENIFFYLSIVSIETK